MQARMGSMAGKVYREASTSIIRELTAVAYRDEISRSRPIFRQPRINRGMFSTRATVPTGSMGRKWLMIWATPVNPPTVKRLGTKNQLKPRAYRPQANRA